MARLAVKDSKTFQLILKPRPEWEMEIRAFKELCARNGLSMSEELYERGIKTFLHEHNWPPGNSQTLLPKFGLTDKKRCFRCEGEFESLIKVLYKSGRTLSTCRTCLEKEQKKGPYSTVKRIVGVI